MAIVTILAIETDIHGYCDRTGLETDIHLSGIEPGIDCKELVREQPQDTVHISLFNAEVTKTVTSILRCLGSSLAWDTVV